jgi:proteasome assembly chaperone 3
MINQLDKVGTLVEAHSEDSSESGRKLFSVQVLLGKRDDPLISVYARQIIEKIAASSDKPLLLAISLRPDRRDASTFQELINKLFEIATWV